MSAHEHSGFAMIPMWMVVDERITPTAIRVYLVLAGHVRQHGTWRLTHAEIQEDSGYKRTAVIDALNLLRDLGVVDWDTPDLKDPEQARGCIYRITVDRAGADTPYPSERTPRVREDEHPVSAQTHTDIDSPKRSKNTPLPPASGGATQISPPGFDDWWSAYPRKDDKVRGRRAYARALKRVDSPQVLLLGLKPWLDYWRQRDEPDFIPMPATWLNNDRWMSMPPRKRLEEIDRHDDPDSPTFWPEAWR